MFTMAIAALFNFWPYLSPEFFNFQSFITFLFFLNIISFSYVRVITQKIMYMFFFLFFFLIIFLYFGFNQIIGFFFLLEISTVFFILALCCELRLMTKAKKSSKKVYFIFFYSSLCYYFLDFYYMDIFNYYVYFENYMCSFNKINKNSLLGLYYTVYDGRQSYIFILGISFVILTYVIVYFYKKWSFLKLKNSNPRYFISKTLASSKKNKKSSIKSSMERLGHERLSDLIMDSRFYGKIRWH